MKYMLILVLLAGASWALPPDTLWTETYGGNGEDMAYSIIRTRDGGFIVCGSTYSFGAVGRDAYVVKCGPGGNVEWTRRYGGDYYDAGYSIAQTPDSGYIMVGSTASFGIGTPNYTNIWLLRMDESGDTLWTKTFGGTMPEDGNEVILTADGGYAIAGFTQSWGAGNGDMYVVKTDAGGDTLWTRRYGGLPSWGEDAKAIQQTSDHGYILTGYQHNTSDQNLWLVRIDSLGDSLWSKSYGGAMSEMGTSVKALGDTGFVVTGYSASYAGFFNFYLLLTDTLGDTLWTRTYDRGSTEIAYEVQAVPGDGFIMVGEAYVDASYTDWWIVKVDAAGDTIWTKTVGYPTQSDRAQSVAVSADGTYLVAGWVWLPPSATNYDMWVVKLAPDPSRIEETAGSNRFDLIARPNPFRDRVSLSIVAGSAEDYAADVPLIRVYDAAGRLVRRLPVGRSAGAPVYRTGWQGDRDDGTRAPAGVYFIRVRSGRDKMTCKIIKTN